MARLLTRTSADPEAEELLGRAELLVAKLRG
jgi:hypothetical protein